MVAWRGDNATIASPYRTGMFLRSLLALARTVRLGHFVRALWTSGSQSCWGTHVQQQP